MKLMSISKAWKNTKQETHHPSSLISCVMKWKKKKLQGVVLQLSQKYKHFGKNHKQNFLSEYPLT
jgi:hypothetical protein